MQNKMPPISIPKVQFVREFTFTDQDFDQIRNLIRREAGIALNPSKKDMVYGRLVRRIRELKLDGFPAYLAYLQSIAGKKEFELFVNALTTNLTFFFREEHHFQILGDYLKSLTNKSDISIWCAASSTGEEPYSIAMTVCEAFGGRANVQILATDLDTTVLEVGRKGIYPADKISRLPAGYATRYFDKLPDGNYQAKAMLRDMISFSRLNLIDSGWPMRKQFDAIFCRNVMIYFDRDTQLSVLKKFHPLVKPHGLLFVGHSENFYFASDYFSLKGKTVYELAKPKA